MLFEHEAHGGFYYDVVFKAHKAAGAYKSDETKIFEQTIEERKRTKSSVGAACS
ncbi:hypothetical protein [Chryseobacterium endophyticum]|uniref:Uncharacterized protein n=1 Tax=Chryseobacterium endophyticum TaxID=1854762 RepID=A0AAU6WUJ8_9FLAO|nr:hypothetical protein [uncultured Chryseobacterium sp.]